MFAKIEKYPHIINKLTKQWFSVSCMEYIETLLFVKNRVYRDGFEHDVFAELIFLHDIHQVLYPPKYDPWENASLKLL